MDDVVTGGDVLGFVLACIAIALLIFGLLWAFAQGFKD